MEMDGLYTVYFYDPGSRYIVTRTFISGQKNEFEKYLARWSVTLRDEFFAFVPITLSESNHIRNKLGH